MKNRCKEKWQAGEPTFVGRRTDHDTWTELGRKPTFVEKVVIERDECAAVLERPSKVLLVGRPTQIVVLHHEQHIPPELESHDRHDSSRHVGIHVDAGTSGQLASDRTQLG